MKNLVFYLLIVLLSFTSCQKEDMISQYKDIITDSTMVKDTVDRKLKLYKFINKVSSKKEPVKIHKKRRFKFRNFIKSKFKKEG